MKKEVVEGNIKLRIDSNDIVSKDLEVFYNPKMALNRSLSVLLLNVLVFLLCTVVIASNLCN